MAFAEQEEPKARRSEVSARQRLRGDGEVSRQEGGTARQRSTPLFLRVSRDAYRSHSIFPPVVLPTVCLVTREREK